MNAENSYSAPRPEQTPFRGDPRDPVPFITDRQLGDLPRDPRPAAYVLPQDGATAGEIPLTGPASASRGDRSAEPAAGRLIAASPDDRRPARVALVIGVLSILVFNLILGPIAVALGLKAIRRGEAKLGLWALSTGVAGTAIGIAVVILWLTGVLPSLDELMNT
ncbi:MAG: hypothetical protein WAO61_09610 [Solirubrobacterales bacterium]